MFLETNFYVHIYKEFQNKMVIINLDITSFDNNVAPGMLESSIQQTCMLQEGQQLRPSREICVSLKQYVAHFQYEEGGKSTNLISKFQYLRMGHLKMQCNL